MKCNGFSWWRTQNRRSAKLATEIFDNLLSAENLHLKVYNKEVPKKVMDELMRQLFPEAYSDSSAEDIAEKSEKNPTVVEKSDVSQTSNMTCSSCEQTFKIQIERFMKKLVKRRRKLKLTQFRRPTKPTFRKFGDI